MNEKTEQKIREFCEYNGYIGKNLHRIADTLEKINWNLGIIANPELKKKYPEVQQEINEERGREVESDDAQD